MRRLLIISVGFLSLGCDRPSYKSEVDDLRGEVRAINRRVVELDQKIEELESELKEAKDNCEANACDCPLPASSYQIQPYKAPKPKKR